MGGVMTRSSAMTILKYAVRRDWPPMRFAHPGATVELVQLDSNDAKIGRFFSVPMFLTSEGFHCSRQQLLGQYS